MAANSLVFVVLDSCRFDSLVAARPRNLGRLGSLEKRWSYASWTSPSHFNLLMGLLPHTSPTGLYASGVYRQEYRRYEERLGIPSLTFSQMLPSLWLPTHLQGLGYRTEAYVSLPVLNPATPLNLGFDHYALMDEHNDFAGIIEGLDFSDGQPRFVLINVGETHYPYALPDEPEGDWPRLHGAHGVLKQIGSPEEPFFDEQRMRDLQQRQIRAAGYCDQQLEALFEKLPRGTWVVVMADHGELFGEGGYFGHGPIHHDKVVEVPFVEGRLM